MESHEAVAPQKIIGKPEFHLVLEPGSSDAFKKILSELARAKSQLENLPRIIEATQSLLTTVTSGVLVDKGCPIVITNSTLFDYSLRPDGRIEIVVTEPEPVKE